jgi:hypothetical protein
LGQRLSVFAPGVEGLGLPSSCLASGLGLFSFRFRVWAEFLWVSDTNMLAWTLTETQTQTDTQTPGKAV